jgi:Na+/phosphate symporter
MVLMAIVPILMAVAGALLYALSANPKIQELGRILFAAGAFAVAFSLANARFSV